MRVLQKILLPILLLLGLCACGEGASPPPSSTSDMLEVHFLDVSQADCALLLCGGESMLIDGGNVADSRLVVAYLAEQGITKLDYVVCTHAHEDHVGGLAGALSQYPAGRVFSPVSEFDTRAFENFLKYTEHQGLTPEAPAPGDSWNLGAATVTVLGPIREHENTNNTSIILRVQLGEVSFLFTGDAEYQAEQDLLEAGYDLQSTVLKVGHHGSSTSTGYLFLREVSPQYAVISVGAGNDYGHPHDEVMSRLRDAQVTVYRTDLQGHIVASTDGAAVTFTTGRNAGADTNPQSGDELYYIGNLNSKVFHKSSCSSLPQERNQIAFSSRSQAVAEGYTPCSRCNP